jgi:hypothetical protein
MKNIKINSIKMAALVLCCLMPATSMMAQSFVPPVLPDNYWFTSYPTCWLQPGCPNVSTIAGMNTAAIDFANNIAIPSYAGTLLVCDYYGNDASGGVVFTDVTTGFTIQRDYAPILFPPYANASIDGSPDIIVGNDTANPLTDFIVAAAYVHTDPVTGNRSPLIDYYHVSYTGMGSFSVGYAGSTTFTGIGGFTNTSVVHLDVISESANTFSTHRPLCDKFVVTWDDWNSLNVYAFQTSLNAPIGNITSITPGVTQINPTGKLSIQPDVAAIQRQVLSIPSCPGPPVHDMALIAYTDNPPINVLYNEWDITCGTVSGVSTLYGPGSEVLRPRIDAPDDFTINDPAIPGRSYFKVAFLETVPGGTRSLTADNQTMMVPAVWPNTSPFLPFGADGFPTVAFGGHQDTDYVVAGISGGLGAANVFMEPIDVTNPWSLSAPLNYYRVNTVGPYTYGGDWPVAISTTCNVTGDQTLVGWAKNGSTVRPGCYDAFYKTTQCYTGSIPHLYSFRNSGNSSIANSPDAEWKVYPNPAASIISLKNPAGLVRYEIINMVGQTVLQGELQAGNQVLDVSILTPGAYNVVAYKGKQQMYHTILVKQ